jgi:hypothetical protein
VANRGTGVSSGWLDSQKTGGYRHELGLQAEKSPCERHRAPTRLAENLSRVVEVCVELWGRGGMCRSWWHILSNVHVPNACYVIISANPLYHVFTEPSFCSATSSMPMYLLYLLLSHQGPTCQPSPSSSARSQPPCHERVKPILIELTKSM